MEAIQEDVLAALENKNPSVKAETSAFLARSFAICSPAVFTKKLLKGYCASLLKALNDSGMCECSSVLMSKDFLNLCD